MVWGGRSRSTREDCRAKGLESNHGGTKQTNLLHPRRLLNTPAPTLVEGLYSLAAAIHPEMFDAPGVFEDY